MEEPEGEKEIAGEEEKGERTWLKLESAYPVGELGSGLGGWSRSEWLSRALGLTGGRCGAATARSLSISSRMQIQIEWKRRSRRGVKT